MISEEAKAIIIRSFPRSLAQDVDQTLSLVTPLYREQNYTVSRDTIGPVKVQGEELHIPFRVYLVEPEPELLQSLTERQRAVLNAVLSRSSDGFIREKHLKELLKSDEGWLPPFVLQLLGEYVLQIIVAVQEHAAQVCKKIRVSTVRSREPNVLRVVETKNY